MPATSSLTIATPIACVRRLGGAAAVVLWSVVGLPAAIGGEANGSVHALAATEINPGVFVHSGKLEDWGPDNGGDVANLGFVVGSRCVAVIDTGGTPAIGHALRAAVERATPLPICYVINTHAHPDHILGNVAFAKQPAGSTPVEFVASAAFAHTLAARQPYYLNALSRDFHIELDASGLVYPTVSVSEQQPVELDLGGRMLKLRAWPTAHTDNDLTVFDERTRTLFAGDLLFISHLPALDGSLRGWVDVTRDLARLDVATVVPGHGSVSNAWPQAMHAQATYLQGLLSDTRAAIADGWTITEATERITPAAGSHWLLTDRFHKRNVTAAFAELEWEDSPPASPATPTQPAASRSHSTSH
ncbi:MAG: quinoprotein relay system zinc metallohydrolase 2 [Burkholderiales bacterium]